MKKMDASAQEALRMRVVNAVAEGMSQSEAARTFKVGVRSVNRWMRRVAKAGARSVAAKRRGRQPGEAGKLTARQAQRIERLIIGKLPDQLHLPFYLWTREAVRRLIKREYGVSVSLSTVGNYLKAWGMSPQRPVRRAYERDEAGIAHWIAHDYPRIAQEAKDERARIYWGDEAGFRSDDVRGRSFAPRGLTPQIAATGKRFGCNMISALTNRGALSFMVFTGRFVTAVFLSFLQRLIKHAQGRKVYLIVDSHPVHTAKAVEHFVAANENYIRLIFLPGYAPELNPDELINHDVKQAVGKHRPRDKAQLQSAVRAWMHRRQQQPHVVRNFFNHEHVRYAA